MLSTFFQPYSGAGVLARSPAVQLQEEVGEEEMGLEVEDCLPFLSCHSGVIQGSLTSDK